MRIGQRINKVLAALELVSRNVDAVDLTRPVVRSSRAGSPPPPGTFAPFHKRPLGEQYAERFLRLCEAAERDLEAIRKGAPATSAPGDRKSRRKREEDRAILAEVGRDPTWVAFVYGRTTEGIRSLRRRHGLDPDTGERLAGRALTSRELPPKYASRTAEADQ